MIRTGVSISGRRRASSGSSSGLGAHVAHRFHEPVAVVGCDVVLADLGRQGMALDGVERRADDDARVDRPEAVEVGGERPLLQRSPQLDRDGRPPLPTTTLESRPGREAAAANSAAEVLMSGPTMCGWPRPRSSISRARNSPIARGDMRPSLRSDPPKPGRSTANSRTRCASGDQIGAKAYTLSGHGLVRRIVSSAGSLLSA
jgi:hypothetical protein